MKKLFFIVPALALGLSACTSEEPGNGVLENGTGETNYLSVSLVSAMGSRATTDQDYEDGTPAESEVKSVRFYFFDAKGEAAAVKYNSVSDASNFTSYFDWTPTGSTDDESANITKKLNATIVINTKEGDKVPVAIVAIANPTEELKALGNRSLSQLNEVVANHVDVTGGFVMSNAVYASRGEKMEAVDIAGHLATTSDAALENPVVIYVERVVAKVGMNMGTALTAIDDPMNDGGKLYSLSSIDKTQEFGGQEIYARILGWNVTATANESRLMKEINASWSNNLFGNDEEWNHPEYFRSYWAQNPLVTPTYSDFNVEDLAASKIDVGGYTYVQENAAKDATGADADTHTKVIVAAQLCDKDGNYLEFAEWGGNRYSVDELKTLLAGVSNIYKVNGTQRTKIDENDLELTTATKAGVTANDRGEVDATKAGRYHVYAQLADAESLTQYSIGRDGAIISAQQVNEALIALGGCKVWKEGYTYYFYDIQHLGSNGFGQYGVVRNHVYKTTITKLTGLGTPVYDPDDVIYPELPEDPYTYIAAQINILSWRIVNQNVDVETE